MTTQEKCEEILKFILNEVNKPNENEKLHENYFQFTPDWGGNTATITINNQHTHVGYPKCTWDEYIDSLYNTLVNGKGLSFV